MPLTLRMLALIQCLKALAPNQQCDTMARLQRLESYLFRRAMRAYVPTDPLFGLKG